MGGQNGTNAAPVGHNATPVGHNAALMGHNAVPLGHYAAPVGYNAESGITQILITWSGGGISLVLGPNSNSKQ